MQLTHGQVADEVIVTLTEKETLSEGHYLFLFTHYTTKQTVAKIYNFTDDVSTYQNRFNQFALNTSVIFSGKPTGQWLYSIYEQVSAVNTDPEQALTLLEKGIMILNPATDFAFDEYTEGTTFKAYNG
jgi:hypothetical protein